MAIFSKECPQCGHKNSLQAAFCAQCGTPMGGGVLVCGACHTENRSNARFCKNCGRPLAESASPEIRGHRWARREEDFAVRVEADDLPGILRRGIIVEMGTNALLVEGGANRGTLGPGIHNLDSLDKRLLDWIKTGISSQVSVLLVSVTPTEMEFNLDGIFTKDPINIGLSVHLQAQVDEPARFLVNMLASRERYTREDLRRYLEPEVNQLVEKWVRQYTILELAEDLGLKEKLELALEEALKATFAQTGLRFLKVRTLNLNMEHLDRIKGIRSSYALQVTEAEAETEGKKRLVDVMKELNLTQLVEETAKVEDEERRAGLYQRMREAVMSGKMDEVRSEAQFDAFLDDMDRQKLLREKERTELLKTWKEEAEDHDRARAHMLAKLDLERQFELRAADLKLRNDLSEQELEGELRLERMRANKQYEIDAARWEYDLKHKRAEAEFEAEQHKRSISLGAEEHDEEMRQLDQELELGLKGLRGMKQVRFEAEKAQKELEWQDAQKKLEIEMQHERFRMEHELNRLDKLATLGTEALIAASPAEQGHILADLKMTEALKGMTEEQILAAAAKDSPDVARALVEKFKAIAEGKSSEREREMYEKLLAEKESRERATIEAWDKASVRAKETTERALDRMAETAQAFARGQGGIPVIITGPGGSLAASEASGEMKTCPNCGRLVTAEARHCEYCGHKFEGVS